MRDEIESRLWADHHGQISGGFAMLAKDVAAAFRALNAQQFDAPWRQPTRPTR